MNFLTFLGVKYFQQEKWIAISLFLTSLASSVLQTNGLTEITSQIMNFAQKNNEKEAKVYYFYFVYAVGAFIMIYYLWGYFQNLLMTKIRPWIRNEVVKLVLQTNNQKFSEINFSKLNSPINRITDMYYFITYNIVSYLLPNVVYLGITSFYFSFLSPMYGVIFLIGNIILASYYLYFLPSIIETNDLYEKQITFNDQHLIDLLSNVDRIIYRGQTETELNEFDGLSKETMTKGYNYYSLSNTHASVMMIIIFIVILISLWILIQLYFDKKIDTASFIASFTILLLYREKITTVVEILPELVDFLGRTENALIYFQHVNDNYRTLKTSDEYHSKKLEFKKIQFLNVTYKYDQGTSNVFENRNYFLDTTDHHIIGITGRSGNGKSTFVKLLLRMYECTAGEITIDGINIQDLDPNYIRQEITYINQSSKLFDRKIIDNIMYGCLNRDTCDLFLEQILKYPNITKLYRNTDIENQRAGLLGENLSGGQRQIANIISGLINPSKILILDEPTNALDPELKMELINMIKEFSFYKQAVIIITHDKDVFPLFSQHIQM